MPRPIRLVYYDEGRFHMDTEAVSILLRVKGPIGVVSVCGPVQHGKSFLSNQLLKRTSGFHVAPTVPGRCTKGLWLWSSPSRKTAADGTEYNMLVMDTEGLNGCAQVEQYFFLAVVLSSMLIYTEVGHIGGDSFDYLSVVSKMTDGDTTTCDLGQFSPIFVWVLRDVYLDFMGMSPSERMKSCLKPEVPELATDAIFVKAPNKVRKSIKAVFVDRHCFTLVRPLYAEKKLCFLDQIPIDRLRKEFKKGMGDLRSFVFEKTKPKKIGETVMTGPIFVQITQHILDAFNSGKRPTIACIWENVEKTKHQKALKSATTATLAVDAPAANTRQKKRSIGQRM